MWLEEEGTQRGVIGRAGGCVCPRSEAANLDKPLSSGQAYFAQVQGVVFVVVCVRVRVRAGMRVRVRLRVRRALWSWSCLVLLVHRACGRGRACISP